MEFRHVRTWLVALGMMLVGCATPLQQSLNGLKTGMDKTDVLEIAGNPRRTLRDSGRDRWFYLFYQGETPLEREVVFENGRVVSISGPLAAGTADSLSSDPVIRDYENLVKEKMEKKSSP